LLKYDNSDLPFVRVSVTVLRLIRRFAADEFLTLVNGTLTNPGVDRLVVAVGAATTTLRVAVRAVIRV
jgi:hypothetical protein